jgi:hypothetical protein
MNRRPLFFCLAMFAGALMACGSSGTGGGPPDGAVPSTGDDAAVANAGDDAAVDGASSASDATGGSDAGLGDDAPAAAQPDAGKPSPDGGACPPSCKTFSDCNSCPQTPGFGGYSCNNGICQFMG